MGQTCFEPQNPCHTGSRAVETPIRFVSAELAAFCVLRQNTYIFALPPANHVLRPGHRIMVQVQSSWFPLYDRNRQTFVPSILDARPDDYVKATQKISVGGADGSYIDLPVVK
jgi:hypothetical protein